MIILGMLLQATTCVFTFLCNTPYTSCLLPYSFLLFSELPFPPDLISDISGNWTGSPYLPYLLPLPTVSICFGTCHAPCSSCAFPTYPLPSFYRMGDSQDPLPDDLFYPSCLPATTTDTCHHTLPCAFHSGMETFPFTDLLPMPPPTTTILPSSCPVPVTLASYLHLGQEEISLPCLPALPPCPHHPHLRIWSCCYLPCLCLSPPYPTAPTHLPDLPTAPPSPYAPPSLWLME